MGGGRDHVWELSKESFYMKARSGEHERERRKASTERDVEAARRRIVER